jgi:hypothetical protein
MVMDGGEKRPIPRGYVAPAWEDDNYGFRGSDQDEGSNPGNFDQEDVQMAADEAGSWQEEESWEGLRGPGAGGDDDVEMAPPAGYGGSESSANTSGSDYETARLWMEKKRMKLKKRGKSCSDTEAEDEDEDEELQDDVVDDSTPPRPPRNQKRYYSKKHKAKRPQSPPRIPAKAKGKGRAVEKPAAVTKGFNEMRRVGGRRPSGQKGEGHVGGDEDEGEEDEDGDGGLRGDGGGEEDEDGGGEEDEDGGGVGKKPRVRGRWSQAALDDVEEFGRLTYQRAQELADKHGKDASNIILRAGLSVKSTRRPMFYNKFKTWYSQLNPNTTSMCIFRLLLLVC